MPITTEVRVRYAETDQMGIVYYANYLVWFEIGRVELLRSLGLSYSQLETDHQRILPVIEPGERDIKQAESMSPEEREEMARAAASAGISVREADSSEAEQEAKHFGTAEVDYIYDQPPRELLDGLLRQYVTSQIYHAVVESTAAEQAARMTAMDAATNNASEMIDSLTLTMNRVRQAAITKEIIEIVSGAAALN